MGDQGGIRHAQHDHAVYLLFLGTGRGAFERISQHRVLDMVEVNTEVQTVPVEHSETGNVQFGHYYWPTEFPIALCGHISSLSSLPKGDIAGRVCPNCVEIRLKYGRKRYNPLLPSRQQP